MKSLLFWCVFLVTVICITEAYKDTQPTYEVMAEGVYDHAEYIGGGGFGGSESTTVYFGDGRTYVIHGQRENMPFPKGTNIKVIRRRTFADGTIYKIEKAPTPEKVR